MPEMYLADEGTLDTVIECSECGTRFYYNFASSDDTEMTYDEFVAWAKQDAMDAHLCGD